MQTFYIQGRCLGVEQVEWIRSLISVHPDWGRFRLSVHIAEQWHWRNGAGQLKDMAARTLLVKLERRGLVQLPVRQRGGGSRPAAVPPAGPLERWTESPLEGALAPLLPLQLARVDGRPERACLAQWLGRFHYLGYRRPVGENLQYLVRARSGRALACLVFGAAAWQCAARDRYIGWDGARRRAQLHLVANNMRFLILPGVRVRHLASHLLGLVVRRLSLDWQGKYGHRIYLLETFVERARFAGAAYRAANWVGVGSTQGRSRNDRERTVRVPRKAVYLYPLAQHWRNALLGDPNAQ